LRRRRYFFSAAVSLILVLIASLLFGHVLGNLYLGNIASETGGSIAVPVPANGGKTKVLRLKVLTYYTVEAAAYNEHETALNLGKSLAENGLPVVVTGSVPHRVRLGFLNNEENLAPLARSILVDGKRAEVVRGEINASSFKFAAADKYAAEEVAPFLGEVSLNLEKALLLNAGVDCQEDQLSKLRPKVAELASDVEALAAQGAELASRGKDSPYAPYLANLSAALHNWGQSLNDLAVVWNNGKLLSSQQQALVVLEEYGRLIDATN